MRYCLVAVAALLASSCSKGPPPSAYKHFRDQVWGVISWEVPCSRTIGGRPDRLPDADCYRFKEPRRLRGVAELGFEADVFYPGRARPPTPDQESDFRVSVEPNLLPATIRSGCEKNCVVALDFIGRRTAVEGGYGHGGLGRHLILVDRIVDLKVLDRD